MTPAPMNTEASGLCIAALHARRTLTLVNLSPCLSTFVRVGDALTLDPWAPQRFGALVAVERAGPMVVHRLVGHDEGRLVLCGDAKPFRDAPYEIDALLGVVTRQTTRAGRQLDHQRGWRRVPGAAPGRRDQGA